MFNSLSIKKADIFVLTKDLDRVGTILYDLKLMEFFSKEEKGFEKFQRDDTSNQSGQLLELRSTISYLKPYFTHNTGELVDNPVDEVKKCQEKKQKLQHEITKLKDDEKRQNVLVHLNVSTKDVEKNKITVGFVPKENAKNIKLLKKEGSLKSKYELEGRIYFATTSKKIPFSYKEFYLPKKVEVNVALQIREKEKQLKDIDFQLEKISNGNLRHLQQEELHLSKQVSLQEAKQDFNKTQHVTALSGYVPAKDVKKLQRALEAELGTKFELTTQDPQNDDEVPTLLNHSQFGGNFENLLRMYSLPKYKEFDPTLLMMFVFPLFYGFVLGDFGYGLISFIIFSLAKLKFKTIKSFLSILQLSSISSMIFGVIYGEYFGFEPHFFPFEFPRAHEPETLLAIAVIFGLVHLNLGFIIGFFNEVKHSIKHAICENLSWIMLQAGLALVYFGTTTSQVALTFTGALVSIVSVILLYIGHGFVGIVEIPSFFTNVLSYARLMAVGISSVVIAMLINDYSSVFFSMGVFGTIGGILLFTIGHIFNIVLGNFESFLHSLRLHFVEFFTKFYHGGGKDFQPFGERIHEFEE